MWTRSPATYQGEHYQISGAYCEPGPDPIPPIVVGGHGEKYLLRAVAKHADWWNYSFRDDATYAHKQEVLKSHCRDVGRDYDEITQVIRVGILIAETEGEVERLKTQPHIRPMQDIRLAGTPANVTETLLGVIGRGAHRLTVNFADAPARKGHSSSQQVCPNLWAANVPASTWEEPPMAIRITRVYTRTGDKGDTALVGGRRVPKDAPRIEAYGTIDELNAIIGLARVFNAERLKKGKAPRWLDGVFRQVQNELFDLGSELATPDDAAQGMHAGPQSGRRGADGPVPEGPGAAQVLHPPWRRAGRRLPPPGAHRLPPRRAPDPRALARRAAQPLAARLRQPAERPALRALALGRQEGRRDGVSSGARLASHARKKT
jgi:hypothetical protein